MYYFDPQIIVEIITNGERVEEAEKLYEEALDKELVCYGIHIGVVLAKLEKKHPDYAKTFANALTKLKVKQLEVDVKKLVELWAQEKKTLEEVLLELAKKQGFEILTFKNE